MDVIIEVLARANFDDEFAIISSQTVTLADEAATVVPEIPAEAAGQDLRLRLQSPVGVGVHLKRFVSGMGNRPDTIGAHGSHGGVSQLLPFRGDECSIVIARAGVALP
ncbi:hypothetical protein [Methylobacterium sp. J-070]|uniref:hypothetical protein n=1 Tax=Methylobacterium sp. J-070 TaxID=2836650 RepID=UPI001FB91E18|nr:hypothetical protein [Methylobacterium sp. J-070]MCJ2051254.1 hypothetical protein [Methylobacterium sp. J-070]